MFTTKNLLIKIGRNALISLGVVAVTVAAIVFISSKINHLADSVALNHHLETELTKRTDLFEELKHYSQIIGTNDVKIQNAYIPSDNILEFVSILDSLAIKNTLTQTYHFETPVPSTFSTPFPLSTIAYSNSFESNVLGFSNYLKGFNQLPYFTEIKGFSITAHDKFGWLGASSVSFNGIVYTKTEQ